MNYLIYLLILCMPVVAAYGASVDVTLNLNPGEVDMVQFFSAREGRTTDQILRRMCDAGIASFRGQYLKQNQEDRAGVMKQLSPEERATVCGIFAGKGAPCPAEEP